MDGRPAIAEDSLSALWMSNVGMKPPGFSFTSASYSGRKFFSDERMGLGEVCPRPQRLVEALARALE